MLLRNELWVSFQRFAPAKPASTTGVPFLYLPQ